METLLLVDVNLSTVEAVMDVLKRHRSRPVSRNFILAQLAKRGKSTTRQRLNRALEFLFETRWVMEGSKGVQWCHSDSPSLQDAILHGRRA